MILNNTIMNIRDINFIIHIRVWSGPDLYILWGLCVDRFWGHYDFTYVMFNWLLIIVSVSLMEQQLLPFRSTWVYPRFLVEFVLLNL